jgi:hypothetical protein
MRESIVGEFGVHQEEEFSRPNTAPAPWNRQNAIGEGILSTDEMNARLSKQINNAVA